MQSKEKFGTMYSVKRLVCFRCFWIADLFSISMFSCKSASVREHHLRAISCFDINTCFFQFDLLIGKLISISLYFTAAYKGR